MQKARLVVCCFVLFGFFGPMSPRAAAQRVIATVPVGQLPYGGAVNTVTNKIYVANQCGSDPNCASNGTVSVIDGVTLSTATVTVGASPDFVTVNETTNKIYVPNGCGNDPTCHTRAGTVTVIDGAALSTSTVPVGANPGSAALNSTTNKIYVPNICGNDPTCGTFSGTLTVIDGSTLSTTTIPVGADPIGAAVDPATNKIYVANACGNDSTCDTYSGTLSIIDGTTLAVTTIPVGADPFAVAVNSTTNKIYVLNGCGNDPSCHSEAGTVTVVDGATLSSTTVNVELSPSDIAVNETTNKVYVSNLSGDDPLCFRHHCYGTVTVIDGANLSTSTVTAGLSPWGVAINAITNKTYVANANLSNPPRQNGTATSLDGSNLSTANVGVGISPWYALVDQATDKIYAINECGTDPNCVMNGTVSVIDGTPPTPWQFVPLTPCRVVDTRPQNGGSGPIQGGTAESFPLPQEGSCGSNIPSNAAAYSLNVTVVPHGRLGYLTIWPTGQPQPTASLMNSLDGRVKADATVVAAGTNQAVSVYVTDTTDVILDINGYFTPLPNPSALAFYPLTPCRVADTRDPHKPQGLGPPSLSAGVPRGFPILSSTCNIPSTAQAYSMNFTVVPQGTLGYLTVWPTGESQPVISTLNDVNGIVLANAAIVPIGTGGNIEAYATNNTDLVIDINGYFAPPGQGGLSLYAPVVCRVLDTRQGSGAFSGTLQVDVKDTGCSVSSLAQAYVFNATVVPPGSFGYLTLWPDGVQQPVVSTLNAPDGAITSNMAIVPTNNGSIDAYASAITQLLLDISGYFAP